MKKAHLLIAFIFIMNYGFAQELNSTISVIAAQGGFDKTEFISLEWSLGENFVETAYLENKIFTQGFHQSFLSKNLTEENLFKSVIYPNPISTELNIELSSSENSSFLIRLFEVRGRLIKQANVNAEDSNFTMNIEGLPTGMYFLQISNINGPIKEIHKIIKL